MAVLLGSFRTRILLIVLTLAMAPLTLAGYWLTGSAARSGEALLAERLNEALRTVSLQIGSRWLPLRSALLDLGDRHPAVSPDSDPNRQTRANESLLPWAVRTAELRTTSGLSLARWASAESDDALESLGVRVPVFDRRSGEEVGVVGAEIRVVRLIAPAVSTPALAGIVIGAFEGTGARSLLPVPFDSVFLLSERFALGDEVWMTRRLQLSEPDVLLVAAAPLDPFTAPFTRAARTGIWLLLGVGALGLMATVLATRRLTSSLEQLAAAADTVARGDLDCRFPIRGPGEVGRVTRAFNAMTESLRRTLHELARHEAQVATGEFAASLAHEVRNPLTAIRIDLQVVEERLPASSPVRDTLARALHEIVRLDETVGQALDQARQGRLGVRELKLVDPLRAAGQAARPEFERRGVQGPLILESAADVAVTGEGGALEQLFLNLLLNAAQATERDGDVRAVIGAEEGLATVRISDSGCGMTDETRERVFEPFFTTRPGGTGLGLPVARRLAAAHGGSVEIETTSASGTTLIVRLPAAR